MGKKETFKGYGPEQGYAFLRDAIRDYYKEEDNVTLDSDEIFISDGAKSDIGNILDIFSKDNTVLVPDPVYPVYVDTNIMDGRKIIFAAGTKENGFLPLPDDSVDADIIYLCSPNNPTGAAYDHAGLTKWVEYAGARDAVILFDAAYETFVSSPDLVRSIYKIPGAQGVRDRVLLLLEDRRLHRNEMRLDSRSEDPRPRRRDTQQALAQASDDQVQRRLLPGSESRRRPSSPRGTRADKGEPRLLP